MYNGLNIESIVDVSFWKENEWKNGYIMRYYNLNDNSGGNKVLLFYLKKDNFIFYIAGCNLILDSDSPDETLKFKDAVYIVDKFNLFNYSTT